MAREDSAVVSVSVDGRDLGLWTTFAGGETDSEEQKFRPNGQDPEVSLGGQSTTENVTVSRLFDEPMQTQIGWLRVRAGKGEAVVKVRPLDADGNPLAASETFTGKLKRVAPPDRDANSNDPAMIELEVSPGGVVA